LVIALINDQLMVAGQPPLGSLNLWLYSDESSAFNEITNGSNPERVTDGFPDTVGWDSLPGSAHLTSMLSWPQPA
jgi:tripeptidyl-peptidase-1